MEKGKKMKSIKQIVFGIVISLFIGFAPANAATCTIKGMDLITAHGKANGNGYRFSCKNGIGTTRVYMVPSPSQLGCKGKSISIKGKVSASLFEGKPLKNKWKISDVTARGTNTVEKRINVVGGVKLKSTSTVVLRAPYKFYISQMKLKHPSKGCRNIRAVLTDAFGS